MHDVFRIAIEERRLLTFEYGDSFGIRLVEPHALGLSQAGQETLIAWQLSGPSTSGEPIGWKNFTVSGCMNIALRGRFPSPRPDYSPARVRLAQVFFRI